MTEGSLSRLSYGLTRTDSLSPRLFAAAPRVRTILAIASGDREPGVVQVPATRLGAAVGLGQPPRGRSRPVPRRRPRDSPDVSRPRCDDRRSKDRLSCSRIHGSRCEQVRLNHVGDWGTQFGSPSPTAGLRGGRRHFNYRTHRLQACSSLTCGRRRQRWRPVQRRRSCLIWRLTLAPAWPRPARPTR